MARKGGVEDCKVAGGRGREALWLGGRRRKETGGRREKGKKTTRARRGGANWAEACEVGAVRGSTKMREGEQNTQGGGFRCSGTNQSTKIQSKVVMVVSS